MNVKILKCYSCDRLQVPPAYLCMFCKSDKLQEIEIPGRGVLYTYSTVHVPIASLEKEAPYTVVIVELNEGCRLTGRLVNPSPEKLALDTPVELIEVRDGIYFFDKVSHK